MTTTLPRFASTIIRVVRGGEIDMLIQMNRITMPGEEFLKREKQPLELLQTAADQYVAQTPDKRRRLLQIMCSNYTISD